ncbi:small ribosomal subunit protein bTHXc [Elaeis guineensis]|uniref:30S ribosomal protein S31, chloroplastic n=1 Tax=Elaeis guineensis var. tenera TaxID=51953 RepID=A0A6I9RAH0_ELAGV|nr:30S ribosomal protein S31, chloroplastic [Elaeis guineensis]
MALLALGLMGALPVASSFYRDPHSSHLSSSRAEMVSLSATNPFSVSTPLRAPRALPSLVYCGRGDKKTAKGKRFNHSFGNARPRNKKKGRGPPRVPAPPSPPKKDRFDDGEVVKIEIDESLFS